MESIKTSLSKFKNKLCEPNELSKTVLSVKTIDNYVRMVKAYLKWYKKVPTKKEKKIINVKAYRGYLKKEKKYSNITINLNLAAIDKYYKLELGIFDENNRLKLKPRKLITYTQEEIKKLLIATRNIKHKLIILFAYTCGLSLSEILNIKFKDINIKNSTLTVSRDNRIVPLNDLILHILKSYAIDKIKMGYLFVSSHNGHRLNLRTIQKVFTNACEKADIPNLGGIKSLRHSYAIHLVEKGTDIKLIKDLIGHSNLKTTMIYKRNAQKINPQGITLDLNPIEATGNGFIYSNAICDYCTQKKCKICRKYSKFEGQRVILELLGSCV